MGSTRIQAFSISAPAALVAVVLAVGSLAQATAAANELKTIEIVLVDEDRLDFGAMRPWVQIPGPRPDLEFKSRRR